MKNIVNNFLFFLKIFKVIYELIPLYLDFRYFPSFFVDSGVVFQVVLLEILEFLLSDSQLLVFEMDKSITALQIAYSFIKDLGGLLYHVYDSGDFDLTSAVGLGLPPNLLQHFLFEQT